MNRQAHDHDAHDAHGEPHGGGPWQARGHDDPRRHRSHGDPRAGWARGGRPGFGPHAAGRARRGDIQTAVLRLLAESPMHGYQIIQELTSRSGGAWNPGPGSVYPTLQAMEDQDLVTSTLDGTKRVYSLTDTGRAAAAARETTTRTPWDDMAEASGPRIELRQALHSLMAAAAQIERTGNDDQIAKAMDQVDQARKGIYLLLAE